MKINKLKPIIEETLTITKRKTDTANSYMIKGKQ